jgi:ferredoxin--NADP+ reductase
LFAADYLAEQGVDVVLLNRDIKPGGLAEYGIYHDKINVKAALRKQFRKILLDNEAASKITYYGNVNVGETADVSLEDLWAMGFDAIMVTVGAQGTKWLGLPGEHLEGVYHAKEIIYHYNKLPPYSERAFAIGQRVALIGVGNVMADIAHWLVHDLNVADVIAVARRGPAEVKFDKRELRYVGDNLDLEDLDREIARVASRMRAVGQDPEEAKAFILSAVPKGAREGRRSNDRGGRRSETSPNKTSPNNRGATSPNKTSSDDSSGSRVRFRFLSAPKRILDDGEGHIGAMEVEDTELVLNEDGSTWPRRMQTLHRLKVDTVIFCIGDRVSDALGLPVARNEFVKCPDPQYPVNGVCYEVHDPEADARIEGVFVAGWARKASAGQVGLARKDGRTCAEAVLQYIAASQGAGEDETRPAEALQARLKGLEKPVVTKADWQRLTAIEAREAEQRGLATFKYDTNEAMLSALDLK